MGLDAWVCCNCIKEGIAPPHPFPELLAFDETGEPFLKSEIEIGLARWLEHDAWYRKSCQHSGRLVNKRLGNIALVGHVQEFVESRAVTTFPLIRERVVYEG